MSPFAGWIKNKRLVPVNDIGVDLGTANTLISVPGDGVVLNEPSVVAVERDTRQVKAVGLEAQRMLGRAHGAIEAIRPLRDGVIADVDVSELMLRSFLKQVMSTRVLRIKPRVVMGVPSGITELERRAVRTSAQAAGANEVYMVPEPMAAAIGVGLPVDTPRGSMVVDIGGGTTEIAVIALAGIVADNSIRIGGDELDQCIVAFLRSAHNLLVGEPTAEAIKMQIGSAVDTGDDLEMEVKGRDLVSGMPKMVVIQSREIRECIEEPLRAIVQAVRDALNVTPPELASDIVDDGIVLTGGGAKIHGLDKLISLETNLKIKVDEDPLTCVVRGTDAILKNFAKYEMVLSE